MKVNGERGSGNGKRRMENGERRTEIARRAHKSGADIAATLASDSSIDRYLNEYSSAVRDPLFEIKAEGTTVHLDGRRYSVATGWTVDTGFRLSRHSWVIAETGTTLC